MTEEDFSVWLWESKVANEYGHYGENGLLNTAITSRDELRELVRLAFESGKQHGVSETLEGGV